jgi:glycosyltransferase 2 family protein
VSDPLDPALAAAELPKRAPRAGRKWLWLAAKLLVVAGAFTFILSRQSWPGLVDALARIAPLSVAIAALLQVGAIAIGTARWRCLLRAYGASKSPSFAAALRVYFVGQFYNTYFPGAVGGDVLRGVLTRNSFANEGGATASVAIVFVERALGLLGVLAVSALAAPFGASEELQRVFLPYCMLGSLGVAAVVAAVTLGQRLARYAPLRIATLLRGLPELQRVWPFVAACLLSLGTQTAISISAHTLLASVYPQASLLESLIAMPLAAGAAFFPLSVAGMGPRDLVLVEVYGTLGIPRAAATATALSLLLVTLLVTGLGGVLQLLAPLSAPEEPSAPRPT